MLPMNDIEPPEPTRRTRLTRWAGMALVGLEVLLAAAVTAALILGFELFLRISFQRPRVRTILLIVAGASLVIVMVRADWLLYRERRRIKGEEDRGGR
jgi:hypothetical protein